MDNFIRKTDLATVEAQRCCASSQCHRIKWRILFVIILIAIRFHNAVLRRSTLGLYSRKVSSTDK